MIDLKRRRLLGYGGAGIVFATGIGLDIPASRADDASSPAAAAASASNSAATGDAAVPPDAFMTLSRAMTGYDNPDPQLAARLYSEARKAYANLDDQIPKIIAAIQSAGKSPAPGPLTFDAGDDASLKTVYHQLLSGWYLGVLGPASAPRCIAFENIVSYRVVEPALYPPSYCVGEPDFWVHAPTGQTLPRTQPA